jgi:hypothetical protein
MFPDVVADCYKVVPRALSRIRGLMPPPLKMKITKSAVDQFQMSADGKQLVIFGKDVADSCLTVTPTLEVLCSALPRGRAGDSAKGLHPWRSGDADQWASAVSGSGSVAEDQEWHRPGGGNSPTRGARGLLTICQQVSGKSAPSRRLIPVQCRVCEGLRRLYNPPASDQVPRGGTWQC